MLTLTTLFVCVNETFKPGMSMAQLVGCTQGDWACTVEYCEAAHHVVAVYRRQQLAAWELTGAAAHDSKRYSVGYGRSKPRTVLHLGEPVPVLFGETPSLRRGVGRT